MLLKIKTPLEFIGKKGLVEFNIDNKNGVNVLTSGNFKQLIKKSELEKIMAARIDGDIPVIVSTGDPSPLVDPVLNRTLKVSKKKG